MRELTSDFIDAATAAYCRPVFLVEIIFSSLTLRLTSAPKDISWDSKLWLGNGWLHPHLGPAESKEFDQNGIEVTLTGLPQDLISLVLKNNYQGTIASLWLTFLDSSGDVVDPFLVFPAKLDMPVFDINADTSVITLKFESLYLDMDRARDYKFDKATQNIFYPDDKGFDEVGAAANWDGFWGTKKRQPRKGVKNKIKNEIKLGTRKDKWVGL